MKLYSYWRSSAAFRVRIALQLKAIEHDIVPVDLVSGEHLQTDYMKTNPQGLVPALELDDGSVILQSTAIIDYLEHAYPKPQLLPDEPLLRAKVLGWAQHIACDIHPLNNMSVMNFLHQGLDVPKAAVTSTWYYHWLERGFGGLEDQIGAGPYCLGDSPGLADVYLIPQIYNARRFDYDMSQHPRLLSVWNHCQQHPAFSHAMPEQQIDAPH